MPDTHKPMPSLLSVDDVADRLGVHRSTISRLIARGDLAIVDLFGGRILIREQDLEELIASRVRRREPAGVPA